MIKSEFYKMMEELCPNDLAESWDNCGIQINTEKDKVNRVLTALEITDSVIDEAVSKGVVLEGAVIDDLVPPGAPVLDEAGLELESCVVGADVNAHAPYCASREHNVPHRRRLGAQ